MDAREALRQVIHSNGVTQRFLAEHTELTQQKISDILNLRRKLDANELFAICKAMRITPDEVFRAAEEQE